MSKGEKKKKSDFFREYIEAELDEMLDSMDERCRQDPELCRKSAIEWIEKNAECFRNHWDKKKKLQSA